MDDSLETPAIEEGENRAKKPVGVGVAIRDDGVLVPMTDGIMKMPNIRPYHGKLHWTLEQRLAWLQGKTVVDTEERETSVRSARYENSVSISEMVEKKIKDNDTGELKIPSFTKVR